MSTKIPANCTVHLLGGTYMTKGSSGGFQLKTGQKIRGSGIDITIVRLTNSSPSVVFNNTSSIGYDANVSDIEISDLTCDANGQNLTVNNTYGGIYIGGSRAAIRRVKIQDLAHGPGPSEVFGILTGGADNTNAERLVIEDCVVMPPLAGTVCTSIAAGAGSNSFVSARISGNWVYGTNTMTVQTFAIGHEFNTLLSGNHILNADSGIASEQGSSTNVTVVNNVFQNVGWGVQLVSGVNQNLYFSGNTFELAYNTNSYCTAFNQSCPVIGEKVIGNTMKIYGAVGPSYYAIIADVATNLIFADNSIDSRFSWTFVGCTNVILRDNVDLLGNCLSSTNQIELPNSLTRKTVSSSSYTAQYLDRYIGVQNVGGATINLPSPTGWSGKDYIIANETSSGTVTVSASPATINGSSSISFSGGYTARTVISDGSNWLAR